MKHLIILLSLLNLGFSRPVSVQDIIQFVPNSIANLAETVFAKDYPQLDVKFYLYTRSTPEGVAVNSTESLSPTDFSQSKKTAFFVYGWHNNLSSDVPIAIREAFLASEDMNVFIVDWSSISQGSYLVAFSNIKGIGQVVGQFISNLKYDQDLEWHNIIISGHSLGAHIAGVAGQAVGGLASLFIGLDPAAPLFTPTKKDNRVDVTSGQFVQVIHTNAGVKGITFKLAHAAYFPNGGSTQPGCGTDITGSCSHERAVTYYAESLKTGNFMAMKCSSYARYKDGTCTGETSWMGQLGLDVEASGNYYLDTNAKSPYAKANA